MSEQEGYLPIENGLCLYYHALGDGPIPVIIPAAFFLLTEQL